MVLLFKLSVVYMCVVSACLGMKWDVFSTKTLYKWAINVETSTVPNSENTVAFNNSLCSSIHVSGVFRHGARNPSLKNIKKIRDLHEKIVKEKGAGLFLDLDTWTAKYNESMESELVTAGIDEQVGLGQRFANRFNKMFNGTGNRVDYVSSRKSRAVDSSKSFHQGMTDVMHEDQMYENRVNDTLLRFYEDCKNYEEEIDDVPEFDAFDDTGEFQNVSEAVKRRLKLTEALSSDELYQIYDLCAYESYIYDVVDSVWCRLMTDAERQILEYGQDIEKWYESSYGVRLASKLACPLVKDIMTTMQELSTLNATWDNRTPVVNAKYVPARFYFGHSETVSQLVTALGLFKDQSPLLASNMATMQNRKFKSSHILPFSANVAFALYACNGATSSDETKDDRQFVVKLFVNEESVVIPACGRKQCLLGEVLGAYSSLIDNCNLNNLCNDDDDDTSGALRPVSTILAVVLPIFLSFVMLRKYD